MRTLKVKWPGLWVTLCSGACLAVAPPPELHVVGNRVETPDGKDVWLQGVNIASLEWRSDGDHVLQSIGVAVDEWKANAIRLPIRDDFWFGKGKGQKDGGVAYRVLVACAVTSIVSRGAYVVLDLHRFRAPTDAHVAFWKEVAARYRKDYTESFFAMLA